MAAVRVRCVGAVVRDEDGRLLVVQRAHPPAQGSWSIPGGRVEPGESDAQALAREVAEETGLLVDVGDLLGTVERPGLDGAVYEIFDYVCTPTGGSIRHASDASDARWVSAAELRDLDCSPGLLETLELWGVLPASSSTS